MAEGSQYVDEAMEVLFALNRGQTNALSPFLFQSALEELGPGNPQICTTLSKHLVHPDDMNIRFKVLEMIAKTGQSWVGLYGGRFADDIVLSMADSNLRCAACAAISLQLWEPDGKVSTPLLTWGLRHLPGVWDVHTVEPVHLPRVRTMISELPAFADKIRERRELPNSDPSLENNIRLWGRFKGTILSVLGR